MSATSSAKKLNLLMEEVPVIKENLISETEKVGGFLCIAQWQEEIFLSRDNDKILYMAKRLNTAYNTDLLAELEAKSEELEKNLSKNKDATAGSGNGHKCGNCFEDAEKKCSNCNKVYYCCR